MKWRGKRESSNVDDRKGRSSSARGFGGFSPNLLGPIIKLLFSKVGLIIVGLFLAFSFITGNNPWTLISNLLSVRVTQSPLSGNYEGTAEENELTV
mgnify:FL=1